MKSSLNFWQSTGTFFAAARLSGATPPPAHVLSRSIGLQVQPWAVMPLSQLCKYVCVYIYIYVHDCFNRRLMNADIALLFRM